jgi:sortase A
MGRLARIEGLAWGLGVPLAVLYVAAQVHAGVVSRLEVVRLDVLLASGGDEPTHATIPLPDPEGIDFSLWDPKRKRLYRDALEHGDGRATAVLRIPALGVEAPVFEGTGEWVLNRGLGRIEGTARFGETGNIGVAGHRDGFFRPLKDSALGQRIEVASVSGRQVYEIDEILVVEPEDVYVLEPREAASLTLVTCYPFYYVGSAPRRFIVHASRVADPSTEWRATE